LKKEKNQMRIAIPTNDGTSISEHFGRSAAFLIFETEEGKIKSHEMKTNGQQHSHAQGGCDHGSTESSQHSHQGILSALDGCAIVICAGMGQRAAEALKGGGVTQIVVTTVGSAEEAVGTFLAGKLTSSTKSFCHCKH
jgi:predicted Fe-Mo cluster-binding NifX family protein